MRPSSLESRRASPLSSRHPACPRTQQHSARSPCTSTRPRPVPRKPAAPGRHRNTRGPVRRAYGIRQRVPSASRSKARSTGRRSGRTSRYRPRSTGGHSPASSYARASPRKLHRPSTPRRRHGTTQEPKPALPQRDAQLGTRRLSPQGTQYSRSPASCSPTWPGTNHQSASPRRGLNLPQSTSIKPRSSRSHLDRVGRGARPRGSLRPE